MPAAIPLSLVAVALAIAVLARTAAALDAVELNLRHAVTTIRALRRELREAGVLAEAVGRDAAGGEATLGLLETFKTGPGALHQDG